MSQEQSTQFESIQATLERGKGGAGPRPLSLDEPAALGYSVWAGVDQPEQQKVSLEQAHATKWEYLDRGELAVILDADGYLVPESDQELIEREHLCHILDVLREQDRIYHLDDDPADQIVIQTGEQVFTEADADYLREEVQRIRNVIGNEMLWEAAWPYLGTDDEGDKLEVSSKPGPRLG